MQIYFDAKRLSRLLSDLHALSGVHVRVLGSEGGVLCESGDDAPFCARMNGCPEGRARCQNCGPQIIRERGAEGVLSRRCHAGVRGLILPIRSGEQPQPLAYLSAGQFLDAAAPGEQWRAARAELDWFPGDADALRALLSEKTTLLPALKKSAV